MKNLNVLMASNNQIENIDIVAVLVNKGAFQYPSLYRKSAKEIGTNIDLTNDSIDYQLLTNQKIKTFLNEKVRGVKL